MSLELKLALKEASSEVRIYVKHLESENKKLQAKCIKLESKIFTDKNRMAALEKELKKGHVSVTIKR